MLCIFFFFLQMATNFELGPTYSKWILVVDIPTQDIAT